MSANERSDLRAMRELEALVRHLGEELAAFRRRALLAESQLKDEGGQGVRAKGGVADRLSELEAENRSLRDRVTRSEDRIRQMLERLRFLRQQLQAPVGGVGAGRS